MSKEGRLPILELFGPTIQGEGLMTGTITHFLRTGGCNLRCLWCDSMHAVDPVQIRAKRRMMTSAEILDAIARLPHAPYITFTGGDPCMHLRLGEIITTLNMRGMQIAVETQGQTFPDWLETADVITFSPKGPSSHNVVDIQDLYKWLARRSPKRPFKVCIKIVCFCPEDLEYAIRVYNALPYSFYDAFYFTAGTAINANGTPVEPKTRVLQVLKSQHALAYDLLRLSEHFNEKVHLGCQQHVLLWPDKDKGV